MNLAEFNYMHRAKVENQLVLPHPPTYVTQEKNKGSDVWYFTSQKFITLKKKSQNTAFSNFLKTTTTQIQPNQKDQQNQTQSNNPTTSKQPPKQQTSQKNQSLLFIFKQRSNYLQSKLAHMIKDHEQSSDKIVWSHEKGRCMICEQLQANDYDFVMMQKQLFLSKLQQQQQKGKQAQGLTQCQTSQLACKIDRILKKMLFQNTTHEKSSQKQMIPKIQSSTFNPYLDHLGSQFKYYITRIQTQKEKHHYMIENKNRVNYRRKVHSNFYAKQQSSNDHNEVKGTNNKKLAQQISSVVWNRQYVLFDVEKLNRDQIDRKVQPQIINNHKIVKVTNSHMKQKITQKCQLIQTFLEKHLNKLFEQKFKNKIYHPNEKNNEENPINKIKFSTNVKQFRLWFINNNMKNNHAYTICISDLKVQFSAEKFGVTFKRWEGNFWARVDLKKGLGIIDQVQRNNLNSRLRNTISSLDSCSLRLKTKSNNLHMKRQNYIKREPAANQTLENKDTIDFKEQPSTNDSQQNCTCCLSLINYTNNIQTLSKRFIISRHIPKLRQMVQIQIQAQINEIKQELYISTHNGVKYTKTRSPEQLEKQNQLIRQLQRKQAKLTNLKSLTHEPNNKLQTISISRKKDLEDLYKRQYEEVNICEQCYRTFLQKVINSKITSKPSIHRMSSIANSKVDSKKVNSFFHKETAQSEKQQLPQSRQRIYSAKNYLGTSFDKSKKHHQHLYSNQFNSRHKTIINSFTLLNSRTNFMTESGSQQQSHALHIQKKERQSTKDNTTIFQFLPQKVSFERESGNIDGNFQKKKNKTRLEKYEEDLQNQNF